MSPPQVYMCSPSWTCAILLSSNPIWNPLHIAPSGFCPPTPWITQALGKAMLYSSSQSIVSPPTPLLEVVFWELSLILLLLLPPLVHYLVYLSPLLQYAIECVHPIVNESISCKGISIGELNQKICSIRPSS